MHQRQTSKNVISQGRSNEGFTTFGDCPHRCVRANEDYIACWSAILSHFHWRFLKENSCLSFEGGKAFEKFKQYKAMVENEIGHKIKVLRSDNGGEFVSKKFDTFLAECGIQQQTSAPYSPQQNGVAERANRSIMECARSMILAQGLELEFWGEVVNTAVYIKN
jgi:hypothetical protein